MALRLESITPSLRVLPALLALACALAGALATLAPAAAAGPPSTADAGDWVTNGPVYAIARAGGRTYVGGDFTKVGPRSGPGVPVTSGSGSVAEPFPEVAGGEVRVVIPDGADGWYIGGDFTHVGGLPRSRIARILDDGTVANFNPGANGTVRALALGSADGNDADRLYVGGSFTQLGGAARNYLGVVNRNTGAVGSWAPNPNDWIHALAVRPVTLDVQPEGAPAATPTKMSLVIVAGDFLNIGSTPLQTAPRRLAAIWGPTAVTPTGAAQGSGIPLNWTPFTSDTDPAIRTLAMPESPSSALNACFATGFVIGWPVYIGRVVSGTTNPLQAPALRLITTGSSRGTVPTGCSFTWTPPGAPNGEVRSLAIHGANLFVAGTFTQIGAVTRTRAAVASVWSNPLTASSTSTLQPFAPAIDGSVNSLGLSADGGTAYLAGEFANAGGQPKAGFAALNTATSAAGEWDPYAAGGTGLVASVNGGQVYIGGSFTSVGAVLRERLAAFDSTGALDTLWDASADASVRAFLVAGDHLYVGGAFQNLSGATRPYLGKLRLDDGSATAFAPTPDHWVLALAAAGDTLYAGGSFLTVGGEPRARIAAVDLASGDLRSWNPGADDVVRAVAASCDRVYAGGSFTKLGGYDRSRIGAVTAADGTALDWNPDSSSVVYAITPAAGRVYAAGGFSVIGSAIRRGIAALDPDTGLALDWNPTAESPSIVRALALAPDASIVYAGGSFTRIGGAGRNRLAAVDAGTGDATGWDPGLDEPVFALAVSGENAFAGGLFRQAGTRMHQGFATFTAGPDGPPPAIPQCEGGDGGGAEQPPVDSGQQSTGLAPSPPPAPPAPSTPADTVAPTVTELRLTNRRFRVGRSRTPVSAQTRQPPVGTVFRFRLSEAAQAMISIHRLVPRRGAARSCRRLPLARRPASCVRFARAGLLARAGRRGRNSVPFSGRIDRRALPAGLYRATVVAADRAGNRSRALRTDFQVVR